MVDKETMKWSGYSLDNGALLWGPVGDFRGYQYYSSNIASYNAGAYAVAYGKLFVCGFGGVVYAFDTRTETNFGPMETTASATLQTTTEKPHGKPPNLHK